MARLARDFKATGPLRPFDRRDARFNLFWAHHLLPLYLPPGIARMCRWFAILSSEDALLADVVRLRPPPASGCADHDRCDGSSSARSTRSSRRSTRTSSPGSIASSKRPIQAVRTRSATSMGLASVGFSSAFGLPSLTGGGTAWYTTTSNEFNVDSEDDCALPSLYKSIRPPLNDRNLQSLCENTSSKAVVGHVRAVSDL